MNKAQEKINGLLESYLEYCKTNGYTDFEVWCEDNINTINEAALLDDIYEEVNYIADKLFDLRKWNGNFIEHRNWISFMV